MPAYDKADIQRRMHGAVEALKHDLGGLRTGPRLDRPARSDPRRGLWREHAAEPGGDRLRARAAAALGPGLGPRPTSARSRRRSATPGSASTRSPTARTSACRSRDLTEERRKELAKLAHQYAEKARIAVRNVRRDGMDALKTDEKKKDISEDEHKRLDTEVQKLTDEAITEIDQVLAAKDKEILQK